MNRLINEGLGEYIEKLSSPASTPGGGNAIGVINSFACGLMLMSLRIAVLKKGNASEEYYNLEEQLKDIQQRSIELAEEDSEKFKEVMATWRSGGDTLEKALENSARVSLKIAQEALKLISIIYSVDMGRFANIITDVGISLELACACFRGGLMNYNVNIKGMKKQHDELLKEKDEMLREFNGKYYKLSEKVGEFI